MFHFDEETCVLYYCVLHLFSILSLKTVVSDESDVASIGADVHNPQQENMLDKI